MKRVPASVPGVGQHRAGAGIDEAMDRARLVPPQDPYRRHRDQSAIRRMKVGDLRPPPPRRAGAAPRARTSSSAAGSRIIGAIQRSISRSNTDSVPIQKIANSNPPSTTPDPGMQPVHGGAEARAPPQPPLARRTRPKAPTQETIPAAARMRQRRDQAGLGKSPDQQAEIDQKGQHRGQDDGFARPASPSSPAGRGRPRQPGRPKRHSRRRWPRPGAQ